MSLNPPRPHLEADFADETGRLSGPQVQWITSRIRDFQRVLSLCGEVRVLGVDDVRMRRAHAEFLGDDSTTDVMTFDLHEGPKPEKPNAGQVCQESDRVSFVVDTDILVCVDEALRQSVQGEYPVEHELLLYVTHGVLHCLGWNDHDEAQAADMHELEDAILQRLGVGPVFKRRNP